MKRRIYVCSTSVRDFPDGRFIYHSQSNKNMEVLSMSFISSAMGTLEVIVIALGAGLAVWGGVNLMEGYGGDNAASNGQGP